MATCAGSSTKWCESHLSLIWTHRLTTNRQTCQHKKKYFMTGWFSAFSDAIVLDVAVEDQ